ncbi:hypothetical protein [Stackebrandtia nassauensis]|uniref:Uncharacterized protein n=1 Tax=Stackebrandtia nassauensis (strain DSM 44728 / CIP 108903 / NRRL B-16338 / NBRC 102104 / LLR-40K-21) TaxID=446470 RepID=D3Q9Q6_STANL|nr:hypothetical protein [Stackebrandtia nassauensis]ADD44602.1 hypothetical protein Snas_4963 [Stackebrandtia nassauensis DSM 44728]
MRFTVKKVLSAAVLVAVTGGALAFSGASAVAQQDGTSRINDSFETVTTDRGGVVVFEDYGPGAPGGGGNDDYVQIGDEGDDGYGVRAYAWVNGNYKGVKYFGKGYLEYTIWDPFGNVKAGQRVKIKVCLARWSGAPNENCGSKTRTITDG